MAGRCKVKAYRPDLLGISRLASKLEMSYEKAVKRIEELIGAYSKEEHDKYLANVEDNACHNIVAKHFNIKISLRGDPALGPQVKLPKGGYIGRLATCSTELVGSKKRDSFGAMSKSDVVLAVSAQLPTSPSRPKKRKLRPKSTIEGSEPIPLLKKGSQGKKIDELIEGQVPLEDVPAADPTERQSVEEFVNKCIADSCLSLKLVEEGKTDKVNLDAKNDGDIEIYSPKAAPVSGVMSGSAPSLLLSGFALDYGSGWDDATEEATKGDDPTSSSSSSSESSSSSSSEEESEEEDEEKWLASLREESGSRVRTRKIFKEVKNLFGKVESLPRLLAKVDGLHREISRKEEKLAMYKVQCDITAEDCEKIGKKLLETEGCLKQVKSTMGTETKRAVATEGKLSELTCQAGQAEGNFKEVERRALKAEEKLLAATTQATTDLAEMGEKVIQAEKDTSLWRSRATSVEEELKNMSEAMARQEVELKSLREGVAVRAGASLMVPSDSMTEAEVTGACPFLSTESTAISVLNTQTTELHGVLKRLHAKAAILPPLGKTVLEASEALSSQVQQIEGETMKYSRTLVTHVLTAGVAAVLDQSDWERSLSDRLTPSALKI